MLIACWAVVAWLVAGCAILGDATPEPPRPCSEVFGTQRCLAMTDAAAAEVGRTRDDVATTIVGTDQPLPAGMIGSGARSIDVRVTFHDGATHAIRMCGGIANGAACMDEPRLEARTSIGKDGGGGYRDVPCSDPPPPAGCGTPLPTLQPDAVAAARPLSIARSSVPIDHLGPYEVSLGEASLANGVASEATFGFVDDWPLDVSLKDGTAQIDLRSLEPGGKPFQNDFEHGWRPGVERVEAVLSFDVLWFEPGASLDIRDIEVH